MALQVNMTGNATGFTQMLNTAKTQAKAFSASMSSQITSSWSGIGKAFTANIASFFTFQGITGAIQGFIDTGRELRELGDQLEMNADDLQKWQNAVDRAGLSFGGFQRIVEAFRAKFNEARTDPKARGELNRLGFTDEDIAKASSGELSISSIVKRGLANASAGDQQRRYLANVIQNRDLEFGKAGEYFQSATPYYDSEDRAVMGQGEEAERSLKKMLNIAVAGAFRFFTDRAYQQASLVAVGRGVMKLGGQGWLWGKNMESASDEIARVRDYGMNPLAETKRTTEEVRASLGLQKPTGLNADYEAWVKRGGLNQTNAEPKKDPFDAVLEQQAEEAKIREQMRSQRLVDSKRSLMTIGDRRASIKDEIKDLIPQIAERNKLSEGEDFLTDAERTSLKGITGKARTYLVNSLRQKYQDKTDELELRQERLTGELREKPLNFSATSLSKVGLYSASAVAFNPVLGIQQRSLQALQTIARNTAPKITQPKDPLHP